MGPYVTFALEVAAFSSLTSIFLGPHDIMDELPQQSEALTKRCSSVARFWENVPSKEPSES